jgi:uncharacterized protein YkuJ
MYNPSQLDENLQYQSRFEYSGGVVVYAGYAPATAAESDSAWVIKKFSYSGSDVVKVTFANDSNSFNLSWDQRAAYSYK